MLNQLENDFQNVNDFDHWLRQGECYSCGPVMEALNDGQEYWKEKGSHLSWCEKNSKFTVVSKFTSLTVKSP